LGCQASSWKKGPGPTSRRTGQDSSTRNAPIRSVIAPATHAAARSASTSNASFRDERDKVLLLHDVAHRSGASELDELLREALWRRLQHEVEGPRQREGLVLHVLERGRDSAHGQELDRRAVLGLVLGRSDRDVADRVLVAGDRLDALLVVADHDLRL